MTHTIFLAFGSNVGEKVANIHQAVELLQSQISNIRLGLLYETQPVGYLQQDNFVNTVAKATTELTPLELFVLVKEVEKKVGRIKRFRWGPREIDIDILFYDDLIYHDENLTIPHARLHEREFVLRPLSDLAPEFLHPVIKKTIHQLSEELPSSEKSVLNVLP